MTHASVFSGIGGPEVAATMLGWENLFHCEINPFGRKVLDYWYPNSKSYEDITTTDFTEWRGRVDVLTGGFPCQPFSYAGRRRGAEDDRYLWPSMYRAIDEIQPTWVVAENVAGILTMVEQGEVSKVAGSASLFDAFDDLRGRFELRETFTLQRICSDLESHGYAVQPVLVPACAVGAPHRRDRVFIVARRVTADTRSNGGQTEDLRRESRGRTSDSKDAEQSQPVFNSSCGNKDDTIPEDSMHSRQLYGQDEVEGSERNIGNVGAGGGERICSGTSGTDSPHPDSHRGSEVDEHMESELADGAKPVSNGGQRNVADTSHIGAGQQCECGRGQHREPRTFESRNGHWPCPSCEWDYCGERWANFPSVSPVHRGNDGIPFDVDCLAVPPIPAPPTYGKGDPKKYPFSKWRTEALKAYGNAIVPQVMYEIFRAIEQVENADE